MLKMKPDGGGRRTKAEIQTQALEKYNIELIAGFKKISEFSDAVRNSGRVASFLDARKAYYLHQDNEGLLQWETEPVPQASGAEAAVFVISMGMGYGSAFPQPSGRFDLFYNRDQKLLSFRVTKENEIWEKDGVKFSYRIRRKEVAPPHIPLKLDTHLQEETMATFGLGFIQIPQARLNPGQPVEFTVKAENRQQSRRWFKLDVNMFARVLSKAHLDDGLESLSPKDQTPTAGDKKAYFGEIHTHSGEKHFGDNRGCGTGTIIENYRYARDISGLDFFALTDHDWQIEDEKDWQHWLKAADEFNEKGKFVTIPALEWTSARYGHRNVYYANSDRAPWVSCGPKNSIKESDSPRDLWQKLKEHNSKALTIPHHPQTGFFPMDWSYHDPEFERLVEIYSTWGNFETDPVDFEGWSADREPVGGAREAVEKGYKLGFIASSDGHDGNAGNAQWCNRQPHIHHRLGSGRVVVWAKALTRQDIFQALYDRRCYGTTGAKILIDFKINENWMGSVIEVTSGAELKIDGEIKGTDFLEKIELIKNGSIYKKWDDFHKTREFSFNMKEAVNQDCSYYYLRITQKDMEKAWSSPCFVETE